MLFRWDEFRKIYPEMNIGLELVPKKIKQVNRCVAECVGRWYLQLHYLGQFFVLTSIFEDIGFLNEASINTGN